MSQSRLNQYGFQIFDTETASDHFPKVTDYNIDVASNINVAAEFKDFKLKQNYPNPFNPNTKIIFIVPSNVKGEMSNVSLKVYDVLGNEIATLVNEELSPGEYEVEFSVGQGSIPVLPSGIYFYQLKVADFIETKKMLLLK
jgi:hypothetical protein